MPWEGWPFERVALLFTGLAFFMMWIQVGLLHWGGAFHRWQMWIPVLYSPVLGIVGLGLTATLTRETVTAGFAFFGIGLLVGTAGTYYHLKTIGRYVLGYNVRNFIAGPPSMLPMMYAAMSAFGVLALYWAAYL